jgi:hypothetical protein
MKKATLLIIFTIVAITSFGQDTVGRLAKAAKHIEATPDTVKPWKLGGFGSLSVNQVYFNNWAAGGESSIGFSSLINVMANYKKGHQSWTNNLDLAYGFMYNGIGSSSQQYRKTDDRIEFTTVYGYGLSKHWDFSLLLNFKTQFSNGFNYPNDSTVVSRFMSPGYLIGGPGFSYKPAPWFGVFISPVTARCTFVLDDQLAHDAAYGVDSGQHFRGEFGAYVRATLNKDLAKNINISSTIDLFTNYLKNFGNISLNWNMLLTMKVTRWWATTVSACVIYDDKIMITDLQGKTGPRTQFKENIGIGLSYKIH